MLSFIGPQLDFRRYDGILQNTSCAELRITRVSGEEVHEVVLCC